MTDPTMHDFGVVAEHGDSFEFHIEGIAGGICHLIAVVQTERGPRRSDLTEIAAVTWRKISIRVVRELAQGMDEAERRKAAPSFKTGANRLSPLVGRELALLLWALQEQGAEEQREAIVHGWRELAREERWWLYAKAAAPGQKAGTGWRRGLFHALSEALGCRPQTAPLEEKKKPSESIEASPGGPFSAERLPVTGGRTTSVASPEALKATDIPASGGEPIDPHRPRRTKKKTGGGGGGDPQIELF